MPTYTKEEIIGNLISNYRELILDLDKDLEIEHGYDLSIDAELINDTIDKLKLNKDLKI